MELVRIRLSDSSLTLAALRIGMKSSNSAGETDNERCFSLGENKTDESRHFCHAFLLNSLSSYR